MLIFNILDLFHNFFLQIYYFSVSKSFLRRENETGSRCICNRVARKMHYI